jgi:tetratricopeptide (TPR) repeat protein
MIVRIPKTLPASGAAVLLCAALLISGGETAAQGVSPAEAPGVLRYGRDDLNKVSKDGDHPLSRLIVEGFRDHKPVHAIWADAAARYVETEQWQAAWDIQRALLDGQIRGFIAFDEKLIQKIVTDILRLPERSMPWDVIEGELLKLLEKQEENACACRTLGAALRTLETTGEASKATALGNRLMRAHPNAPLGVEAAKNIPASLTVFEAGAGDLTGTRAGVELRFRLADALAEQGRQAEAVSAYEKCLRPDVLPDDEARALRGILASCEQAGDYAKAVECATRLLERLSGEEAVSLAARIAALHLRLDRRAEFFGIYANTAEKYGAWQPAAVAEFLMNGARSAEEKGWLPEAAGLYSTCWCVIAEASDLRASRLPSCTVEASVRIRFWKEALGLEEGAISQETVRTLAESGPGTREAAYFHYASAEDAASKGEFSAAADHARTVVSLCRDSSAAVKLLSRIEAHLAVAEARDAKTREQTLRGDGGTQGASVEELFRLAEERRATGDASAAVNALLRIAAEHPESELAPRALYDAAMMQRDALEDPRGARASLDRLSVVYPDSELGITALRLLSRMDIAR